MSRDQIIALFGATLVGLLVRLSNVIITWLSRVLKVAPPEAIIPPGQTAGPPGTSPSPQVGP